MVQKRFMKDYQLFLGLSLWRFKERNAFLLGCNLEAVTIPKSPITRGNPPTSKEIRLTHWLLRGGWFGYIFQPLSSAVLEVRVNPGLESVKVHYSPFDLCNF